MANEHAGRALLRARRRIDDGESHIRCLNNAARLFRQWGAIAKVKGMIQQYSLNDLDGEA